MSGLNEAFVIDQATRDRLIREDRKSAELIMPWIRGKDIKRWTHEFHDLYVIIVRYGFHAELKRYPAILRHLSQFEKQLKARGQCKTSRSGEGEGQHHWLELDNNPSESYVATFAEPKIVFNETSKRLHAYLDTEGNAINKTGFIILTPDALVHSGGHKLDAIGLALPRNFPFVGRSLEFWPYSVPREFDEPHPDSSRAAR